MNPSEKTKTYEDAKQKLEEFIASEPMWLSELQEKDFPDQEWLVEGIIPAKAITVIYGHGGVYKTRLTMDMIISAAAEKLWLDKFMTKKIKALFVDEENTEELLWRQFEQLEAPSGLPIGIYTMEDIVISDEYLNAILQKCKTHSIDVVVFDPLAYIINGANENDAAVMAMLLKKFQILTKEGVAVILLHHSNKSDSFRGSSAILGAVGSMIHIKLDDNVLTLAQDKSRHGIKFSPFKVNVETSDDEEHIKFCYGGALGGEAKKTEELDIIRQCVVEVLKEHKRCAQIELVAALKPMLPGIAINDTKLRKKVLPPMLKTKIVGTEHGSPGNTLYYFLVGQLENKEPGDFATEAAKALEDDDVPTTSWEEILGRPELYDS